MQFKVSELWKHACVWTNWSTYLECIPGCSISEVKAALTSCNLASGESQLCVTGAADARSRLRPAGEIRHMQAQQSEVKCQSSSKTTAQISLLLSKLI